MFLFAFSALSAVNKIYVDSVEKDELLEGSIRMRSSRIEVFFINQLRSRLTAWSMLMFRVSAGHFLKLENLVRRQTNFNRKDRREFAKFAEQQTDDGFSLRTLRNLSDLCG